MKTIGTWFVPRMWDDGECWIIGGGSSLPRQFGVPESIIKKVMEKKITVAAYSDYFKPIHDRHVIGTNAAYFLGDWISILYFGDLPFFRENKYQLYNFLNLKVTSAGNLPVENSYEHKNIKKLKRDLRYGLSEYGDTIRWNGNAGGGAINLAAHLGVKRILLLGFDMKANEKGQTHWHVGLPNYLKPTEPLAFFKFLKSFPAIASDAKRRHIEILNVSEDSALDVFPKVKLKDVL